MPDPSQPPCPYAIGQRVIYRPSRRGVDLDAMTPVTERLVPGERYLIAAIEGGLYVLPEGYKHPGGGIFWTEFAPE